MYERTVSSVWFLGDTANQNEADHRAGKTIGTAVVTGGVRALLLFTNKALAEACIAGTPQFAGWTAEEQRSHPHMLGMLKMAEIIGCTHVLLDATSAGGITITIREMRAGIVFVPPAGDVPPQAP